jgi:hypothetical protein
MGKTEELARASAARASEVVSPEEVLSHLEEVLASPAFRSSHRSQEFLRYVVTHSQNGEVDQLKERLLGERIFGRTPDYDTGQDSIVRVKANEVRRRLAQYYDLHSSSPVRIDLAPGTYVPHVHYCCEGGPAPATAPAPSLPVGTAASRTRRLAWVIVLAAASVVLAVALTAISTDRRSGFYRFWEVALSGPERLVICIPNPETYRIYGPDRERLIDAFRPRAPGTPRPAVRFDGSESIIVVPEPNLSVGLGDARSLALIHSYVQGQGMMPQIRLAGETTFTELRASNVLLLGGFTNRWTLEMTKDLRYHFYRQGELHAIRESATGKFLCRKPNSWEPPSNHDCALVTRLVSSKTGRPLLIAAGLDHYGTLAVGEFVTRPELLGPALDGLPEDWRNKSLQIVLQVEVVRDNVGPPKVIAAHVW